MRGGVIGNICIKSEQILREECYNLGHNWIYFIKIEISAPQVQISPLMTPGSAWISTFPIFLAQVWLQYIEIWSECVSLGFIWRDFGNCSLFTSTLLCPHIRSVVNINYLVIGRLNLEGICIPTSFPGCVYSHTQYICIYGKCQVRCSKETGTEPFLIFKLMCSKYLILLFLPARMTEPDQNNRVMWLQVFRCKWWNYRDVIINFLLVLFTLELTGAHAVVEIASI